MSIKVRILFSLLFLVLTTSLSGCMTSSPAPVATQAPVSEEVPVASGQKVEPAEQVQQPMAVEPAEPVQQPMAVKPAEQAPQQPAVVKTVYAELYVNPIPADARIRILNIGPKFAQGMKLVGGRYLVEVSAPGHQKYQQWITLDAGKMTRLKVELVAQ